MSALEKGRVTVECGSGAYYSVLSGRRHQGRTVQRAKKQLAARLLVGDAILSVARLGRTTSIYLHMGRRLDNHDRGVGKLRRLHRPLTPICGEKVDDFLHHPDAPIHADHGEQRACDA